MQPTSADVRAWARAQGLSISDRGRLAADVVAAYERAHGGPAAAYGSARGGPGQPSADSTVRCSSERDAARAAGRSVNRTLGSSLSNRRTGSARLPGADAEAAGRLARVEQELEQLRGRVEALESEIASPREFPIGNDRRLAARRAFLDRWRAPR